MRRACQKCGGVDFTPSGKCRPCASQYNREWNARNKERIAEYNAWYNVEHREKKQTAKKRYRLKEDRKSEHSRRYTRVPDIVKTSALNSYHKRRAAMGDEVANSDLIALKKAQPNCCYCRKPADSYDHILPIARGGRHILSNLQRTCRSCNSRKKDKTHKEFLEYLVLNPW